MERGFAVKRSLNLIRKARMNMTYFNNFMNDEEGQDLVEYALLLGFVAIVCVPAITTLGTKVNSYFSKIGTKLT